MKQVIIRNLLILMFHTSLLATILGGLSIILPDTIWFVSHENDAVSFSPLQAFESFFLVNPAILFLIGLSGILTSLVLLGFIYRFWFKTNRHE